MNAKVIKNMFKQLIKETSDEEKKMILRNARKAITNYNVGDELSQADCITIGTILEQLHMDLSEEFDKALTL